MVPVKKVRILGKDYRVEPFDNEERYGECCNSRLRIRYLAEQPPEHLRDTMIHEPLHAIDYAMQIDLEEKQVQAIASGLYAFMVENKALIRWIIGDTNGRK